MHYLLIFTVGPVQSLINYSRKITDMYGGSKLLSGLMREAVDFLNDKPGIAVLFPVPEEREHTALKSGNGTAGQEKKASPSNMPNRLIAEISTVDAAWPAAIGLELETYVKQLFLTTCSDLFQQVGIDQEGWILAERQLGNYLEVYWMAEPYDNRPYMDVYRSLFRSMQEVKSIRPFAQAVEPWNRKCMLFPEYNAVFVKKKGGQYPANVNPADIFDITNLKTLCCSVKQGEALSAIALVKRIYPNTEKIVSLRQMLLCSRVKQRPDGIEMGDSRLANAVYDFENGNSPDYDEYDQEMWNNAAVLCENLHEQHILLSSYYAMVKLDGDSMGEEFLKGTQENQRALSQRIGKFAKKIPAMLRKYQGLSVYSGGEDFLGFLPLDTLFSCLEELHSVFRKDVGVTFSAGIAVAHLMQPLKEVAAIAEEMEHLAKRAQGKNACVLGLCKRGGEMVVTPPFCFDHMPFDDELGRLELHQLSQLVAELNQAGCSKSLLYHLGDLFRVFLEEGAEPHASLVSVLVYQAAVCSAAQEADNMTQRLMAFYENDGGLAGFMNILNAAAFLAREVQTCTI